MNRKNKIRIMSICIATLGVIILAVYVTLFLRTQSYAKVEVETKRENTIEWLRSQKETNLNLYVDLLKNNANAKVKDKLYCLLEDSFNNIVNIHIEGYTDEQTAMLQLQPLFWIEDQLKDGKINNADAYKLLLLFHSEEDDSGENEEFMNFIYKEAQSYLPGPNDEVEMNRLNEILNRLSSFLERQNEKRKQVVIQPLASFLVILKHNLLNKRKKIR